MKRLFLILFALTAAFGVQAQGIEFRKVSLQEALAAAGKENKLVFVDCYTQWCGPCKQMEAQVFPDPEAGAFMNPRFVSVQIDMEHGEGTSVGAKYKVNSYPTFLILAPDGSEINRSVGSAPTRQFIANMERLSVPENSPEALAAEYAKGGMSNSRLFAYINSLLEERKTEQATSVAQELAGKLTDVERKSAEFWPLLSNRNIFPYGSDVSMFIVDNRADFEAMPMAARYFGDIPEGFLDMHRRFAAGERDKAMLRDLAMLNYNKVSRERASMLGEVLFEQLSESERIDPAYFREVFGYLGSEESFDYLLKNRERFYTTVGRERVDMAIWVKFKNKSMMVIKGYDTTTTDADFERMLAQAKLTAEPEKISNFLNMAWAQQRGDTAELLRMAQLCFKTFDDSDVLNFMPAVAAHISEKATPEQSAQLLAAMEAAKAQMKTDTGRGRIDGIAKIIEKDAN